MASLAHKTRHVRLPDDLDRFVIQEAKRRNASINTVFIDFVAEQMHRQEDRDWAEAFDAISEKGDWTGIESMQEAQKETFRGLNG